MKPSSSALSPTKQSSFNAYKSTGLTSGQDMKARGSPRTMKTSESTDVMQHQRKLFEKVVEPDRYVKYKENKPVESRLKDFLSEHNVSLLDEKSDCDKEE